MADRVRCGGKQLAPAKNFVHSPGTMESQNPMHQDHRRHAKKHPDQWRRDDEDHRLYPAFRLQDPKKTSKRRDRGAAISADERVRAASWESAVPGAEIPC